MRNSVLLGSIAIGAMTAASHAVVINVPDFLIDEHSTAGGDDPLVAFNLAAPSGTYTDVTITFDYVEVVPDATWASDLVMQMTTDAGYITDFRGTFGGSGSALDGGAADENSVWAFDGSGSGSDGTYAHSYTFAAPVSITGSFDVAFSDVFNGNYNISNMTIELIPTPGAFALLGLAGLAGRRRRRA